MRRSGEAVRLEAWCALSWRQENKPVCSKKLVLLSANLVLANGTALVVSDSSHPDLFWALRGAGHNFGIITSVEYRIEDIPTTSQGRSWAYEYVFLQDRPEDLFGLANDILLRS